MAGLSATGAGGAVAGAVAVVVVAQRLGPFNLARPLNATAVVLPLLAGLVATWAVLCRDRLAVVPALACLSFAVQTHLGVLGVGAVALAVVVTAAAWGWWRDGRRSAGWAVGSAATLVIAWGLVVAQQFSGDPGNLSQMLNVARAPVERAGVAFGVPVVLDQVARVVWPGGRAFPRVAVVGPIDPASAAVKAVVAVGALVVTAVVARRTSDATRGRLLATLVVAAVVAMAALSQGPSSVPSTR